MRRMVTGLLCIAACHGEAAVEKGDPALSQGAVRFETARGPWIVRVEIASDDASRTRGLMYRRSLEPDRGMIFVFPVADLHTFWMRNTLVPLDMIWMDEEFTVVHVERSVPPCKADPCPITNTPPADAALEVNAGTAKGAGIAAGALVESTAL